MANVKVFSTQQKIRIKKVSTLDKIKRLYEDGPSKYRTLNNIFNDSIDIGLDHLLDKNINDKTTEEMLNNLAQRVIMNQNRQTQKILYTLNKSLILSSVMEQMIGSLIHEFEIYLEKEGITFNEKMLEKLKKELPERFERDKQILISKLMGDEE